LLRRVESTPDTQGILRVADLEIDQDAHIVSRSGEVIDVTPTEFNILVTMASQAGRAFTRLQLLEATQGVTFEGYERTIDAHIKNLRAKIEPDPKEPIYIETVFGVGYRFKKG
jgi:DNA-binding response OmpR family regulator